MGIAKCKLQIANCKLNNSLRRGGAASFVPLVLSVSVGLCVGAVIPSVIAQEAPPTPQVVLDVYLALIERGDYAGAFNGYCVVGANPAPNALEQLRQDVDRLAKEVDLPGVVRSLALFAPLAQGPFHWTPRDNASGPEGTWIDFDVSTQMTFPLRVFFQQAGPGWKIDAARTLDYNAQGTKVGAIIAQTLAAQGCREHLTVLALAFRQYMDANHQRLPSARSWRQDVAAYLHDRAVLRCPGGDEGSLAMNRNLSNVLGREIVNPEKTILIFDAPSGEAEGDGEANLEPRHGGEANVLLADGSVRSVRDTRGLKWTAGPPPVGEAREVRVATATQGPIEFVAVREVLEPFGARIAWNPAASATVITVLGHTCQLIEGSPSAMVDGRAVPLPAPAVTRGGKLEVPVSFLSRAFGLRVAFGDGEVIISGG